MTFKNKVVAGFGTALAILVFVGVLSYQSMRNGEAERQWVMHTNLVLEAVDSVLANVLDIESSVRGYLLTGDESYLEPKSAAIGHLGQSVKEFRELTVDNPVQQESVGLLEPLIAARLQRAEVMIGIRLNGGLAAAADASQLGVGKRVVDQIRYRLRLMKSEEDRLLKLRMEAADRSARITRNIIAAGGALAICFLCIAGFVVGLEMQERSRAEEQVHQLNVDLEQRVADRTFELNERAKDLARSNSELQQFAYVASHDLQEPLRMVASFTQLLAKRYSDKLDDDAREFINFAVDGAMRMQTLISDLLSYSRIGTQGKQLALTDSDALYKRVLDSLQLGIQESGAEIVCDPLPMVMADPQQLGQLFQNLLTNAIKFKGEAPIRIRISVERSGSTWKISVRDNGIGISQEHAERIFIIFQRLHTKTEYPGTGIGLAICKKIVELHGGRIWIEPSPGGGTTFCFTIPAVENRELKGRIRNELRVPAYAS
jgi:signal transduction histidine kinase